MINMQRRVWEQDARLEGAKNEGMRVALNFIKKGIPIDKAADASGISASELEEAARKAGIKLPKMV